MLEKFFSAPKTLRRLRSGISGPHIDAFADDLEHHGYARASAVRYLRAAAHLDRKLGLVCTLLASLPFTRIPAVQSPIADLLPLQGHILSPPAPDPGAPAIAIRYPVLVKAGPKILKVAGNAPDSPSAVRTKAVAASPSLAQNSAPSGISLPTELRVKSPGWWPTKGDASRDAYVGAAACVKCHASNGCGPATYGDGASCNPSRRCSDPAPA
jgi:hypothetical protein